MKEKNEVIMMIMVSIVLLYPQVATYSGLGI